MVSPLLRPARCIHCGTLSRRVVTCGPHYYCAGKNACLIAAMRDGAKRLGMEAEQATVEAHPAALTAALAAIRAEFDP